MADGIPVGSRMCGHWLPLLSPTQVPTKPEHNLEIPATVRASSYDTNPSVSDGLGPPCSCRRRFGRWRPPTAPAPPGPPLRRPPMPRRRAPLPEAAANPESEAVRLPSDLQPGAATERSTSPAAASWVAFASASLRLLTMIPCRQARVRVSRSIFSSEGRRSIVSGIFCHLAMEFRVASSMLFCFLAGSYMGPDFVPPVGVTAITVFGWRRQPPALQCYSLPFLQFQPPATNQVILPPSPFIRHGGT